MGGKRATLLDPENAGYRFWNHARCSWVRIRPRMEPPVDAADFERPEEWSSQGISWTDRAILWEVLSLADQLAAANAEIEQLRANVADSNQLRGEAICERGAARSTLADRDAELRQARGAAADLLRLLDQEKGRHPDACHWPGCKAPGLCASGNFGNLVVCGEHFKVTNGAGRFWEGYNAGKMRERAECKTKSQHYEEAIRERDEARTDVERLAQYGASSAHETAWLRGLLAEERKRAGRAEAERNQARSDAAKYCSDRNRAREGHQEAADLAALRLAEIQRLRARRVSDRADEEDGAAHVPDLPAAAARALAILREVADGAEGMDLLCDAFPIADSDAIEIRAWTYGGGMRAEATVSHDDSPILIRLRAEGLVKELREAMGGARQAPVAVADDNAAAWCVDLPTDGPATRPPIGIPPEFLWREERCRELAESIARRDPDEFAASTLGWANELSEHLYWLAHRNRKGEVAE